MRIRPYVYASLALAAALPSVASAIVTVATTTIQAPAGNVPPGSTVSVVCRGEGNTTTSGMLGSSTTNITSIDVTVSGGTVDRTQFTGAEPRTCSSGSGTCSWLEGTATWTTPPAAGTYTATCTVHWTNTTSAGTSTGLPVSSTAPLTTVVVSFLPPVVGAVTGPAEVVTGGTGVFEVSATDPNAWPLTYNWSATGGSIVPDAANRARASWTAPATPGAHTVNVSVSNGPFTVPAQKSVNVVLAAYQAGLPVPLVAPRRIAAGDGGALYLVDGQQGTTGQVLLATAKGEARGFAALPEPALAVTSGAGVLWVTTTAGSLFKLDPVTGQSLGKVALQAGPFGSPAGIAYDAASMTLWVADSGSNVVRVIRPDGTTVATIASAGGAALVQPVDVAIDAGKAWVLIYQAVAEDDLAGAPIAAARYLHAFDMAAQYLGSYVAQGNGAGQLVRAGGIAVGPAGVYVADVHEGKVQVVTTAGAPVGTIGSWGQEPGQLMNPWGLELMANGDLAVANTSNSRVERYGSGAPLPTCAGDADCDLLPDAWESANGLDPSWAGDALLDVGDSDGLNNAAEHAAGTNPRAADTDGDGYSDADELATGFDPTNRDDHSAMVSASGPGETPPGLVKLRATATGPVPCTVGWTQQGGPPVTLAGADSDAASFVARAAGTYAFDALATCGALRSNPSRATVVVRNVAPLADAGGVLVAAPGTPVRLDALASSDANGDAIAFTWDQTLGAPLVGTQTGGSLTARPRGTGLYAFQVTVADGAGQASTAEVPVLVAEGQPPTAIAAAIPAETWVGATVVLDASTSIVHEGSTFSWRELSRPAGTPAVTLTGADQPVASFAPVYAGRYAFDVVAGSGPMRAPPARVEVFVAEAGGVLPAITATAPSIVAVGQAVSLEATPSPAAAQVAWRQVSGPAAGLTEADRASATVVPFSPGFHVFEAAVADGAAEGRPARVAFEARAGGTAIPQARVTTAPGDAWVGQLVFLDGRASTGAARFRWTQVAGPWVALGSQGSVTTFRPLAVGRYAFELAVDDGTTRSAPARIEVNVVAPEGVQ